MRIVADTNTVVSGLLWKGPPRLILNHAREQAITLCTSAALIEELADVLSREKFANRLRLADLSAKALVEDYLAITDVILVPQGIERVCRDPDDDQVLACGQAAGANFIVSGDDDLLQLRQHRDIAIVTAAEFLDRMSIL